MATIERDKFKLYKPRLTHHRARQIFPVSLQKATAIRQHESTYNVRLVPQQVNNTTAYTTYESSDK